MQMRMDASQYQAFLAMQGAKKSRKHRNCIVYLYADGFVCENKLPAAAGHGKISAKFDSKKEYVRWKELQLLERAGKISHLERQVPFLLHPEFVGPDGKKKRATYYNADFCYDQGQDHVVEDVKGQDVTTGKFQTTETFRLKWKLLQASYPDKKFVLF